MNEFSKKIQFVQLFKKKMFKKKKKSHLLRSYSKNMICNRTLDWKCQKLQSVYIHAVLETHLDEELFQ